MFIIKSECAINFWDIPFFSSTNITQQSKPNFVTFKFFESSRVAETVQKLFSCNAFIVVPRFVPLKMLLLYIAPVLAFITYSFTSAWFLFLIIIPSIEMN